MRAVVLPPMESFTVLVSAEVEYSRKIHSRKPSGSNKINQYCNDQVVSRKAVANAGL